MTPSILGVRIEDASDGRSSVGNAPTCEPLLIWFPSLKRWQPPKHKGWGSERCRAGDKCKVQ